MVSGGLDRLPIGDDVPDGRVVLGEIVWRGGGAGADDEPEPGVLQPVQVRCGQHAGVRDDHDLGRGVTFAELVEDGQQGEGLAPVARELVDFEGEPALVHEEADEDLRVDAALFAHPDLAELVFTLRLEVEGGDVVEHHGQRTTRGRMRVGCGGDLRPPVLLNAAGEGPPHGRQRRRTRDTELVPHPQRVRLAGRLDDAGQDQLLECVVADRVEPETGVGVLEDIPQQPGPRPGHRRRGRGQRRRAQPVQIERDMPGQLRDPLPRDRDQHRELPIVVRGAEVLHDRPHTTGLRRDLHRRRTRRGAHLPHEPPHRASLDRHR